MIAHHTFSPWRIRNGDERIVVPESAWRRVASWDRAAAKAGERRRVLCPFDVFEDWPRVMVDAEGNNLRVRHDGSWILDGSGGIFRCDFPLLMKDVRRRLFTLIGNTRNLDWLLLTKRIENVPSMMASIADPRGLDHHSISTILGSRVQCQALPPNVWLGTSVEDQATANERIPHLLKIPATVRFLSCEPLLGPVDIVRFLPNTFTGFPRGPKVDWVIVGGESGPRARPMHPDWVRSIRDQCTAAGVPFFFKQWGEFLPEEQVPGLFQRPIPDHLVGKINWPFKAGQEFGPSMVKLGKKATCRHLDGREWNEVPTSEEATCKRLS